MTADGNALLAEIAGIGVDPFTGGYLRPVFSPAELELRAWFVSCAEERGLDVETDGNGIVWAWWDLPADAAAARDRSGAILTGSHLDSVPGGGNFDGPLGVVSALAAIDVLRSRGVRPRRPLAIAVFPEEEGSRFGLACLGSRLLSGAADPVAVRGLSDATGRTYAEVSAEAGLDPALIGPDLERLARIAAFIELHVEQGRGLVDLDRPVALAGGIIAHGRWRIRIDGRGDHAGATRMADRQDPVVVAAEAVRSLRAHTLVVDDARGTIGRIEVVPGGTNVIASSAEIWMDVRHRSEDAVRRIVDEVTAATQRAADAEGCTITVTEQSFSPTVEFDGALRAQLQSILPEAPVLDTGAGHDAGILAASVPTAMLFVRNPTGASHTPAETAEPEDVDAGVTALADVLGHLLTH
ncbi:allantoate amidohydrolase [Microbacterium sp. Sa4CUA7]|uniref:Allantoate amidohydrolase n=1 Tax=Microbacterium pullorum TaxID=2762236 RepID=A0ABR8S2M1_9MICO|nr:allantoate amidohydrolase [Microbacterium pullorum]MBD7957742.1 allantoate amidohydrolase [Microbacterium pullorum]